MTLLARRRHFQDRTRHTEHLFAKFVYSPTIGGCGCRVREGHVRNQAPGSPRLASHNRPFHEVLFSTPLDIRLEYERTFVGMTTEPVTLERLLDTRARLQRELPAALDTAEREFLQTLARAEPDWSLLDIPHLEELPAVRWKLQNLQQLALSNKKKFDQMVSALDDRLQQLP